MTRETRPDRNETSTLTMVQGSYNLETMLAPRECEGEVQKEVAQQLYTVQSEDGSFRRDLICLLEFETNHHRVTNRTRQDNRSRYVGVAITPNHPNG